MVKGTLSDDPRCVRNDFIDPFALAGHLNSLPLRADGGTYITICCTFVLLDILLVTDTCDHPDLLVGECFSALFEYVGVTDVE
jgi:hypothetical protein